MTQLDLFRDDDSGSVFDDRAIEIALPLIKEFEGFRSAPYADMVGVPTIGYGSTYYSDGRRVSLSDPSISEAQASELLVDRIRKDFLPTVQSSCPNLQTRNQVAALISFTYNLGATALHGSTLRKKVEACDFTGASEEFLKWDMAGGREVAGLKRRRCAEKDLFTS